VASADAIAGLRARRDITVEVSALTGQGMDDLQRVIAANLPEPAMRVEVTVPYTRGELVSEAHSRGTVIEEAHGEHGTRLVALVEGGLAARLLAADVAGTPGTTAA
jgi:GTP-binding protein HflX